MTQTEFATAVEASQRSVVRWEGGTATPAPQHLANLAALLHPRGLAAEVAAHAGATLISLNLEAPPPAPPVPPFVVPLAAPPPPARPRTKPVDLVDVLVLAAMLEMSCTAPDARRWLHAVMKRARDIGLTIEEAEEGLRPMTAVAAAEA
jgi:DNA-binding XRE family transcriptional regulator